MQHRAWRNSEKINVARRITKAAAIMAAGSMKLWRGGVRDNNVRRRAK